MNADFNQYRIRVLGKRLKDLRKQYASLLKNDKYQIDMIYYSFIMLYYPDFGSGRQ